jgi:glycerophosphoryl diester phosphodiesterase
MLIALALLVMAGGIFAYFDWTDDQADAKVPTPTGPRLAGHRGTTVGADENTISAFTYAWPYADILETDVRLTSDQKMVIMHDATLDRTTSCTGKVSSRTLAYIKACRTDHGHHPPSLRQFLQWAQAQPDQTSRDIYLELKGTWTQTQVQAFVNETTRYELGRITANSFLEANLTKVAKANDALPDELAGAHLYIAWDEGGAPTQPFQHVCDRYDGYFNPLAYLTAQWVDNLQQVCNPSTFVGVYGHLDTTPEYEQAFATGAQVIVVEDPKEARQWLAAR